MDVSKVGMSKLEPRIDSDGCPIATSSCDGCGEENYDDRLWGMKDREYGVFFCESCKRDFNGC